MVNFNAELKEDGAEFLNHENRGGCVTAIPFLNRYGQSMAN